MPYNSQKQRKFFHTLTAKKAGITPKMIEEYDSASKGIKLPEVKIDKFPKLKKKLRGI